MAYSVAQLKTDLTGILHGTNLNKITGLDQLISRAAREVLLDVDPQETKRIQQLDPLFERVFDVTLPVDLKGNKVIDIFPQTLERNFSQDPQQVYNREFDLFKTNQYNKEMFTILHNTGVKTMRIDNPNLPAAIIINDLGDISSNGTWTAFGDATNVQTDTVIYAEGASSIRFDLNGNTTNGGIQVNMTIPIDLTAQEDISSLFNFMYLPNASGITSIGLRWGSSATDYWEVVNTMDATGVSFKNFWNRLKSNWNAATTTVGTPNASAVDYLRINVIYDGTAQSGLRADRLTTQVGEPYNIEYYSKYLFADNTGAFIESVTDDTNTVNLDTETYNLLLHKVAELAFQQQSDHSQRGGGNETSFWAVKYIQTLNRYKALYKSELVKPRGNYYRGPTRRRYSRRRGLFNNY